MKQSSRLTKNPLHKRVEIRFRADTSQIVPIHSRGKKTERELFKKEIVKLVKLKPLTGRQQIGFIDRQTELVTPAESVDQKSVIASPQNNKEFLLKQILQPSLQDFLVFRPKRKTASINTRMLNSKSTKGNLLTYDLEKFANNMLRNEADSKTRRKKITGAPSFSFKTKNSQQELDHSQPIMQSERTSHASPDGSLTSRHNPKLLQAKDIRAKGALPNLEKKRSSRYLEKETVLPAKDRSKLKRDRKHILYKLPEDSLIDSDPPKYTVQKPLPESHHFATLNFLSEYRNSSLAEDAHGNIKKFKKSEVSHYKVNSSKHQYSSSVHGLPQKEFMLRAWSKDKNRSLLSEDSLN